MYLESFNARLDWRLPLVFFLFLLPLAYQNFALFHTLVEGGAIFVAVLAFVVAFNTYPFSQSHYLMYLGCGYFWVGMLDLCHALSYPPLNVFSPSNDELSVDFWLLARLLECLVLASFTWFVARAVARHLLFALFGGVFIAVLMATFSGLFPTLFTMEAGQSDIKIVGEFVVMAVLIFAIWRIWRVRKWFYPSIVRLLIASISLTIAAELVFTLISDYSVTTLTIGHMLKLLSFWLIYVALVESTLTQPFKSLSISNDTFNALPDAIAVVARDGTVMHVNSAAKAIVGAGMSAQAIHVHEYFHNPEVASGDCPICRQIKLGEVGLPCEVQHVDRWFEVSLSAINYYGRDDVLLHICRDVTAVTEAQLNYHTANRLYTVLRLTNKAIISSKTKQDLLDAVCHIAVDHGGFKMAWIGMKEGDTVVPVSSRGDEHNYLDQLVVKMDDSPLSKGPVGLAIKSAQVAFVNDIEHDLSFAPWRNAALVCGLKSIAAVPVVQQHQCVGVFVIYAAQVDAFDPQTLELLSSLSDDISSVVAFIQAEEKRIALEAKLRQLSLAIEQSKSAILITDIDGNIEYINPYYTELTGFTEAEMLGKNMSAFPRLPTTARLLSECRDAVLTGRDWHGEVESIAKDGQAYWALQSVSPIVNAKGRITHIVWTAEDNTDLHNAHETISQLAYFDALTGLPNRRLYQDRFHQAIVAAKRHQVKLAVFYLDLDNFKLINDSWGHDFGDVLLKHVAKQLSASVREMDTVARLGGDEFSILINDVIDNNDVVHVATDILHRLNRKAKLEGRELTITTSIGVSLYPDDGEDAATLMKHADLAMYHAKEKGKNNFQFFEEFLNVKAQQRLQMEMRIEQALKQDAFLLYYQPQFDIRNGNLSGVEALIRWPDGDGGFISPVEFIPIAEESALIIDIGNWVIKRACHEFKRLIDNGFPTVKMAINISASQFHHSKVLLENLDQALADSALPHHLLQLELTESVLIEDVNETVGIIDKLRQSNISFAIDDFGTGYSSLSYLKSFPADVIKIDRSFVLDIETDSNDQAIIRAICSMAHELDLKVLAEGVETQQQLAFLQAHQCDFVQGYYFAKPMPAQILFERFGQSKNH